MVTLKDVAAKTGVSIATVSRVLNKDTTLGISASRKQEILDVVRDLNYKSPRKRIFKEKNASKKIIIITRYSSSSENTDPYFLRIRLAIENYIRDRGFSFSLVCTEEMEENTLTYKADGYIFIGVIPDTIIQNLSVYSEKMVFIDSSPKCVVKDTVLVDFRMGVDSALDHFVKEMGYTSVGYIGGETDISAVRPVGYHRLLAFKSYMTGIDSLNEHHIFIGDFSKESGYQLMKTAINSGHPPRAFFIASDSMAIGALKALNEQQVKVPDEIAIIGFNDNEFSSFTYPPLTTIKVHIEFMSRTAVELLLEQFEGRTLMKTVITPTELILRKSH